MDFLDVAKQVARIGAPILGSLIAPGPGTMIGGLIASALGDDVDPEDPESIAKAIQGNPDAAIKLRQLEIDHAEELKRLAFKQRELEIQHEAQQLDTVNETMRAEYAQEDKYVKRWRPTMGYGVTFSWILTWLGVVYVLIWQTDKAPQVVSALSATSVLWGVALSVLGISVYKRSADKQTAAGVAPQPGIMGAIAQRIAPGKA